MIRSVAIVGAGSAGLIAALALQRRFPTLPVTVIRSADIGVIGVGEGTTQQFPRVLFSALGVDAARFYAETQPQWKLGLKFLWGPRAEFYYSFSDAHDFRVSGLPRNNGFYETEGQPLDLWTALMEAGRVLPSAIDGGPVFFGHQHLGFHIENVRLVGFLEALCRERGVLFRDATVEGIEIADGDISALRVAGGEKITADFFVDASGFRSELLGRAFGEPFTSYSDALFCDRAVIGGWDRNREPILPYTTCETMDAGWCWQIEHERFINRGYVYSSAHLDDEDARSEFLRKNLAVPADRTRIVKFRSGRYRRMWVGNAVAVGNASGFVEPLEATALGVILSQAVTLADCLEDSELHPTTTVRDIYNRTICGVWDDVRDFLSVHYRFNTRLDTPFWHHCREHVALGGAAAIVDFYRENGPSSLAKNILIGSGNPIGWEGYLALLAGQDVPHERPHTPSSTERAIWEIRVAECRAVAAQGFTPERLAALIRAPGWDWSQAR